MKGLKNVNPKNFMVFIVLTGVIVGLYFYLNGNKQVDNMKGRTEAEKLLLKDLDGDYPATPTGVVKLYNRISKCLYNDPWNNDEVNGLIDMMRELFSVELLENNPAEKYNTSFKADIADYHEKRKTIMTYKVDGSNQVKTQEENGAEYATLNSVYSVAENKDHYKIYQRFILKKEGNQWKILGWKSIPDTEVIE